MSADASKPKSLFIGGPRDGDWDLVYPRIPTLRTYETMENGDAKISMYRAVRFMIVERLEIIYIHESMTTEEAFEKLMKGYKP